MVKFSFIVPVYNIKQDYLEQCIDSILDQTNRDFEIVLIDDGSSNGAGKWCDAYARKSDRFVRVCHKKNEGVSAARNKGIQEARGKYLIFVDPDDWIATDTCERINSILEQYDFDILTYFYYTEYTDLTIVNKEFENGLTHKLSISEQEELLLQLLDAGKNLDYTHFHSTIFGSVWGKCFKRSFILENDIRFKKELIKSEDTIFNLDAFFAAKIVIEYRFPMYHYRMVKNSVTHRYNVQISKIQLLFLGAVKEFMQKHRLSGLYREAFVSRCISSYFSVLELDTFHCENKSKIKETKKRWESFIDTEYIRDISRNSLKKYSWRMKMVLFLTHMHLFRILKLFYNFRDKSNVGVNYDNLFE